MNKEEIILRGIDEIPMFSFNTKTKEFSVLGHKFEGVNSIEDFINYIHNLDKENKQLQQKVNQLKQENQQLKERTEYYYEFDEYLKKEDLPEELRPYYKNQDCCRYIVELRKENQELKKQLEHFKTQEIERISKNLLQAENDYLERCIKANMVGGSNE